MLNLFYKEPDPDRWFLFDHFPRRIFRTLIRGKAQPSGQRRVFLNLCAGLDRLGIGYRVNDFRHARLHPKEPVGIVGKPFLLDKSAWSNPIIFGAAVYSHPIDDPKLLDRLPIRRVLVPGPWMEEMCRPWWGSHVRAWPVGIDTDLWSPVPKNQRSVDVLLYDKVMWNHEEEENVLIAPIRNCLSMQGRSSEVIRYGYYREDDFKGALSRCRAMIFLCEHETQGIAYQQALASGVPILAWDRGGVWRDPSYYPDRVVFRPVTSVPYWDERCGERFSDASDFEAAWDCFWDKVQGGGYAPRDYILDHLTLENCAKQYVGHVDEVAGG